MLRRAEARSYGRTCLVPTSFFAAARAMCASFGFASCPKFDAGPEVHDPISIYFERVTA